MKNPEVNIGMNELFKLVKHEVKLETLEDKLKELERKHHFDQMKIELLSAIIRHKGSIELFEFLISNRKIKIEVKDEIIRVRIINEDGTTKLNEDGSVKTAYEYITELKQNKEYRHFFFMT